MSVSINGTGSITGLSVGGLPDGSVDADSIAAGAVTDAKIGTGINAAKLADGTVTSTELQYINSLSSNAQTQLAGAFAGFPIGAAAYVTGGQAISNNAASTLIGNTEVYDPNSNYNTSNGTYTVPSGQAGKYLACGWISIPVVDPLLLGLGIKVDGTAKIFQGQYGGADTGGQSAIIILDLSVGAAVTWYCHHKAGSTKTTEASAHGTGMSIQRIA